MPSVEASLKDEQADQGLALAGVELDNDVTVRSMIRVPLVEDGLLGWSKRPLIGRAIERLVQLDRVGRAFPLLARELALKIDLCPST